MARKIKIDDLDGVIRKELELYDKRIVEGSKKVTRKVTREMVQRTKQQRYKRDTGAFRDAIASTTLVDNQYGLTMAWYVRKPHYRLTHLLERPHRIVRNGRVVNTTRGYHFVEKAADQAEKELVEGMEKVIADG